MSILRVKRLEAALTQRELSDLAGVDINTIGDLEKDWHDLSLQGHNARTIIKAIEVAKTKAMDALPGDDGAKHRYTWIDENGAEPVQYVVATTPPTEAKDIEFRREPKRRATVDKQEAPRG